MLEKDSNDPNLWNDQEKAQSMMKKIGNLRDLLNKWNEVSAACNDLAELYEMSKDEESEDLTKSIESDIADLKAKIEEMEFKKMLNGPDDACACLLSIHPGAGGTESQDWALMLFRMYTHFFEREKMDFKVVDFQEAEDAGLKSATIEVTCENAYGLLRSEIGVHRLVRISPFDASGRRQTSFAAIEVTPEIDDSTEVDIRPEDIDIVPVEKGILTGVVTSVTFKGVHFEIIVDIGGFKWMIQTTDFVDVGERIGLYIEPDAIHIMKKSEYSGMFGDYSSYSEEFDEMADPDIDLVEETKEAESYE